MREIVSPLDGFLSPFGRRGGAAPDAYAIGGASPELVAAFLTAADGTTEGEYFRTAGATDDFSMFTFSRSGLATMSDSTGTLVWAPHNVLRYSEDFSSWNLVGASYTAETNILESTGTSASSVYITCVVPSPGIYKLYAHVEAGTADKVAVRAFGYDTTDDTCWFDLSSGTKLTEKAGVTGEITAVGDGSYICSVEVSAISDLAGTLYVYVATTDNSYNTPTGANIKVYKAWAHRSDLGGMADNPDQTVSGLEKYVPTTSAAAYLSRRNAYYYNGTAWTKGGLQLESAAATNLYTNSNDFSATPWAEINTTLSSGTAINGIPATTCTSTDTVFALLSVNYTFSGAGTYTNSIYVRPGTATVFWADFRFYTGSTYGSDKAYFDTATETVSGVAAAGFGWEKVGSNEYRIWFTSAVDAGDLAGAIRFGYCDAAGSDAITLGATADFAGGQLEAGSFPTSYIPTTSATVTRAAETLSIAAADLPYSATAMSISMKGLMTYADTASGTEVTFLRWYADASNSIQTSLYAAGAATGQVRFTQVASGVSDLVLGPNTTYSPGVNLPFNIASRHGATFLNGAISGTALSEDLTPTSLADLSSTSLSVGFGFNGFISEFRMWGTDIGDSGIEEVTA